MRSTALALIPLIALACDARSPTSALSDLDTSPSFNAVGTVQCETITFDDQGFSHGSIVTSLTTGFGFNLTVTVDEPNGINTARAFDTDTDLPISDDDLQTPPQGVCEDCVGLGNFIVIEDPFGFYYGDSRDGGIIRFTGFAGWGPFYVESFKAIDQESVEGPIRLRVDGVEIGASSGLGNGSVETVVTETTRFEEVMEFELDGTGAADDIVICRETGAVGRMTGGGTIRLEGLFDGEPVEVRFTNGFTLHCDIELSNNLEINWGGNQWHIEKESLEHVECINEPDVAPEPPPAPFDTFIAAATGRLNGEWGSHIAFTLQDAGEPGGNNDKAGLAIWDVGVDPHSGADPIIVVPFDFIVHGNLQAHYDQPHGCNVNRPC